MLVAAGGRLRAALALSVITLLLLFLYRHEIPLRAVHVGLGSHTNAGVQMTGSPSNDTAPSWTAYEPVEAALVVAGRNRTWTSWLNKVSDKYKIYKYNVDYDEAPPGLQVPLNKGHEAMVYLSFIIDYYDALPTHTVFIHGHEHSWHQQADMVTLMRGLKVRPLDREGYISLRCDWYPSCPAEIRPKAHDAVIWGPGVYRQDAEDAIAENWDDLFPGEELPETIASPCCAQFAVTKKAILRRSKADYERLRRWLIKTTLVDEVSGRVLEKLWAYIMTGKAVHCPPQDVCACQYFGQCDEREWPVPPLEALKLVSIFNSSEAHAVGNQT